MRLSRRHCALAAAMLLLSAPATLRADPPIPRADVAALPPSTRCRVELATEKTAGGETIDITYEGKVVTASPAGLTLAVSSTRRKQTTSAQAARIPFLGRLFTNLGIAQHQPGTEPQLWLPIDKIETVQRLTD